MHARDSFVDSVDSKALPALYFCRRWTTKWLLIGYPDDGGGEGFGSCIHGDG